MRFQNVQTSDYSDDAVLRHGILESDFGFLQKSFTPASLAFAQKVREVLDQPYAEV